MANKPKSPKTLEKKGYTGPAPRPHKVNGGYQGTGESTNTTNPPKGGGGGSQSSDSKK